MGDRAPRSGRGARQIDVLLDLDLDAGAGVRGGIEAAIRRAVASGALPAGTRMPASRALAADLGVSRSTASEAYAQLVAEGWLAARPGSGTWVADAGGRAPEVDPIDTGSRLGETRGYRYAVEPGWPDLSSFPRDAWRRSVDRALATAPHDVFGYVESRGDPTLRATLAEYLGRVRGVRAHPEQVLVCSGFTQALSLLCRVVDERSGCLAAERPGHWAHAEVLRTNVRRRIGIAVDEQGARVDSLDASDATAMLLTPAHQYPTGAVLSGARREAVVGWARRRDGLVIEDDYDGEFQYDAPVGALQALDPDRVAYCGSLSKTLAPGLRIGWMVLPPAWVGAVARMKRFTDQQTDTVTQAALAEFIASGEYDRHLRRRRADARTRRDALVDAVRRAAPWVRVSGERGGVHVVLSWADEPGLPTVARVHDACRGERMAPPPELEPDGVLGTGERGIVVGYASPLERDFPGAVRALCAALRAARGSAG